MPYFAKTTKNRDGDPGISDLVTMYEVDIRLLPVARRYAVLPT
jgi:hypothetical protein